MQSIANSVVTVVTVVHPFSVTLVTAHFNAAGNSVGIADISGV